MIHQHPTIERQKLRRAEIVGEMDNVLCLDRLAPTLLAREGRGAWGSNRRGSGSGKEHLFVSTAPSLASRSAGHQAQGRLPGQPSRHAWHQSPGRFGAATGWVATRSDHRIVLRARGTRLTSRWLSPFPGEPRSGQTTASVHPDSTRSRAPTTRCRGSGPQRSPTRRWMTRGRLAIPGTMLDSVSGHGEAAYSSHSSRCRTPQVSRLGPPGVPQPQEGPEQRARSAKAPRSALL